MVEDVMSVGLPEEDVSCARSHALLEVVRLAFEGGIGIKAEPSSDAQQQAATGPNSCCPADALQCKGKRGSHAVHHKETSKQQPGGPCQHCGTTATPQWRRPRGTSLLLCNACGIFFTRYGKLPEQRCAAHQVHASKAGTAAAASGAVPVSASMATGHHKRRAASPPQAAAPHGQPDAGKPMDRESAPAVSSTSTAIIPLPAASNTQTVPAAAAMPSGAQLLQAGAAVTLPCGYPPTGHQLLSSQPITIPRGATTLAIAHTLGPRLFRRDSKRRERQPGVESDDSNLSTDSHTMTHPGLSTSHEEDEGRYMRPRVSPRHIAVAAAACLPGMSGVGGPSQPVLCLPAPRSVSASPPEGASTLSGLVQQASNESVGVASNGLPIFLPVRASKGPRSRAGSVTPVSSVGC